MFKFQNSWREKKTRKNIILIPLKGVFAKNERGYRLADKNKHF